MKEKVLELLQEHLDRAIHMREFCENHMSDKGWGKIESGKYDAISSKLLQLMDEIKKL